MPMLIPNHQSISKSIESISKTGIDIDAVVRNSLSKLSKTHHGVAYMTSSTPSNNNNNNKTTESSSVSAGSHLNTTTSTPVISGGIQSDDASKKLLKNNINNNCNNIGSGKKAMPLSTRNKNSIDLSGSNKGGNMSLLAHRRKLSKTSLLRAKVRLYYLLAAGCDRAG